MLISGPVHGALREGRMARKDAKILAKEDILKSYSSRVFSCQASPEMGIYVVEMIVGKKRGMDSSGRLTEFFPIEKFITLNKTPQALSS